MINKQVEFNPYIYCKRGNFRVGVIFAISRYCLIRENFPHAKIKPIWLYERNMSRIVKITPTWKVLPTFSRNFPPAKITTFTVYFIKIVPFWLRNIRFLIQNTRSLLYGRHYSSLHRLMSLHGKMDVKIFLMFIVAENSRSVNIVDLT